MNRIKTKEQILKEVTKDFTYFLRKNGIYQYYKRNITNGLMYNEKLPRKDWKLGFLYGIQIKINPLTFTNCCQLINSAFYWAGTPQGHRFWEEYHQQWLRFSIEKYSKYKDILNN